MSIILGTYGGITDKGGFYYQGKTVVYGTVFYISSCHAGVGVNPPVDISPT